MEYVVEEAKSAVDDYVKYSIKQHIKKVKIWIKNNVPFIYRTNLSI